jgi:hypothetical protein
MIKRIIEHREYQQLRKDQLMKAKMRQAMVIGPLLLVLLIAGGVVSELTKTTPTEAKPVSAVSTPTTPTTPITSSQETQDIEKFADVVTQPLETLSSEDLDFVGVKAKDPCYADNVSLPPDEMIEAITACKASS